ncbi:hypothetical protein D7B24_005034 [Verticillium nonalfalfae]|uniref:SET domain-containing protein n=1 Tax=Verticillium nonalfalfae TaxID=1051616 RepID=A0A3M9YMF8_9PEZI|nr:uncharacterized protein D7B24_005034 [Verticillium nonalfalfae]RNJ60946.1 hypothetical protein D7B24_005034 [Verticillium nonalfalfae]
MSDIIHDLLDWSKTQNVVLNGIKPNAFPGRGIGLISTRAIKEGDVVLEVPTSAIKTLDDLPPSLRKKLPSPPDTTVHALLALDLATDASSCPAPWRAVLPSRADIATMPLTWDERLHPYLPPAARELLKQQKTKFEKDFANCVAAVPGLDESRYRHAWLLVNSRTFYHTSPLTAKLPKEDHLSLQPVADLFNHAARGCTVAYCDLSYTVTANTSYPRGAEIPICYGRHSNDFLLVEYGFILEGASNEWDEVSLDDVLLPRLRKPATRKRDLEDAGFWGRYVLDSDMVCFRTQVAVRSLVVPEWVWRSFAEGRDEGEGAQWKVDTELKTMLEEYDEQIEATVKEVESLEVVGEAVQREIIVQRWRQIQTIVGVAIKRLAQ